MAGGYFSWEFIVDNQSPFTNVTSVQEANCDSATSPGNGAVPSISGISGSAGAAFDSVVVDNVNFKEGTGSLKFTKASPVASTYYIGGIDMGSAGVNLSTFDRLRMWYRCDQAGQFYYVFGIMDSLLNKREWVVSLQGANIFTNIDMNMANYSYQTSTAPNLSSIRYFYVAVTTASTPPSSINVWMDDVRLEIGYINHCEDTNLWTVVNGTSTTFSNNVSIYKNSYYGVGAQSLPSGATAETSSLSSVKLSGTSTSGGALSARYTLPISAWNLTSPTAYDFLLLWVRADFGGATTGTIKVYLNTTAGSAYYLFTYASLNAMQFYRLAIPVRNPTSTFGTPNLNSITTIDIESDGALSSTSTLWIDEIAVDVGNWTNIEFHVPDNISQSESTLPLQFSSYNGASYVGFLNADGYANGAAGSAWYALNGSLASAFYSTYGGLYPLAPIGSSVSFGTAYGGNGAIAVYTTTYGCNNRLILQIKLPPASSDSNSGNLPSDDMSGPMAISKARLKIQIYIANETTTYGF